MSYGKTCDCTTGEHPQSSSRPGQCPRYAADQDEGGWCSSCARDFHMPCVRFNGQTPICADCGWHVSQHQKDR